MVARALGFHVQDITWNEKKNPAVEYIGEGRYYLPSAARHLAVGFAGYIAGRRACLGDRRMHIDAAGSDFTKIEAIFYNIVRQSPDLSWLDVVARWRSVKRTSFRVARRILVANSPNVVALAGAIERAMSGEGDPLHCMNLEEYLADVALAETWATPWGPT